MPLSVLIAGGGVGGLEAALALDDLAGDGVDLTLLAPDRHFTYRPLAVAEPFGGAAVLRFPLAAIAGDRRLRLVRDAVASVDAEQHVVRTQDGRALAYDALVLAIGAVARESVPGTLTFRGPRDVDRIRRLVDEITSGAASNVAFVVPPGASWSLPLYELALATSVAVRRASGRTVRLNLVTPERAPLEAFGPDVSKAVARLLAGHGIVLHTRQCAAEVADGRLWLSPGSSLPADRAVSLPRLAGRRLPGIPAGEGGFAPVDGYGRVIGLDDVYAVGDGANHELKQGGLAAQQADVVAASIAASLGAGAMPEPYQPVLRGVLLTGDGVRYLRWSGFGDPGTVAADAPWWPGAKIAGRYLAPYLATHLRDAEGPAAPATAPSAALPVA